MGLWGQRHLLLLKSPHKVAQVAPPKVRLQPGQMQFLSGLHSAPGEAPPKPHAQMGTLRPAFQEGVPLRARHHARSHRMLNLRTTL